MCITSNIPGSEIPNGSHLILDFRCSAGGGSGVREENYKAGNLWKIPSDAKRQRGNLDTETSVNFDPALRD